MNFFVNNINLLIKQIGEVGKIKKKELDKNRLEKLDSQEKFIQDNSHQLIKNVENKDTSLLLVSHENTDRVESKKKKQQPVKKNQKVNLKDEYKGHFLDLKE